MIRNKSTAGNFKKIKALLRPAAVLILTLALIAAGLFAGCAKKETQPDETAATPETTMQPTPAHTPIATTQPDTTPEPEPEPEENPTAIEYEGWIYYLDENDRVVVEYSEDPPLYRMTPDEVTVQDLGIRGFGFEIIGGYIYVDSNDADLDETGIRTWGTTVMNLDGSDKRRLEYGSMSTRLVPEGADKFYFTTLGDSALYYSDFSCTSVIAIKVTLPDEGELRESLGFDNILQFDITGITGNRIEFEVSITSKAGAILYSGTYTTTVVGTSTEKLSGTYYEYGAQENE